MRYTKIVFEIKNIKQNDNELLDRIFLGISNQGGICGQEKRGGMMCIVPKDLAIHAQQYLRREVYNYNPKLNYETIYVEDL